MEKTRPIVRRRSGRLQHNDSGTTPISAPPIQRRSSGKRSKAAPPSGVRVRPKISKDQKTLTQIDFVTRANPIHEPDLDLDYIEDHSPPPRRPRNQRKKRTIDRNQGNTLTQMDYVARRPWGDDEAYMDEDEAHIPGTDDEDDDDLERVGMPPRWEAVQDQGNVEHTPSPERGIKRRRLENSTSASPLPRSSRSRTNQIENQGPLHDIKNEREDSVPNPSHLCTRADSVPVPSLHPDPRPRTAEQVTPKKQQKWEIPSSQSPESPGFIMAENSPRSPLKTKSLNATLAPVSRSNKQTPSPVKTASWNLSQTRRQPREATSKSPITVESQYTPRTLVTDNETPGTSPMLASAAKSREGDRPPPPQSPLSSKSKPIENPCGSGDAGKVNDSTTPKASANHVVYDTDEESEDEFQDDPPHSLEQGVAPGALDQTHGEDDSGDMHGPSNTGVGSHSHSGETGTAHDNQSTAISHASLLYCRRPQDFPRDPTASELSNIDPDRLADLFPANEQETMGSTLPPYSHSESISRQPPRAEQNPADLSTEFIPESSQHPAEEEGYDVPQSSPPEVILVESSQPSNSKTQEKRSESQHSTINHDIFAASQLLPDSLLESIPGPPPHWMFSDDTSHE
ncbi:hypothetical protein FQN54_007156 [Arachnomyces sp. PD_36]|nr:hypothetical protein FQN54_007156 [Arachnomyces sp. PD_36]